MKQILIPCALLFMSVAPASADLLFGPGDPILAIDTDMAVLSSYPLGENPGNTTDQITSTKYLNFAGAGTGFIVTPAFGTSTVQSFRLTTANDSEGRDPASYDLYGTNDLIISGDNSLGNLENWTLIGSGGLSLPSGRETPGSFVDVSNNTGYSSYKMIFPTVKGDSLMQVADVAMYSGSAGTGAQVLAANDFALAVTDRNSESNYPPVSEGPGNAIDGTISKYLNFGKENSGFIVSRADGLATIMESFAITTANDYPGRDPAAWVLYGTNDPVTSTDNSLGNGENWTMIDSGSLALPDSRETLGSEVLVSNATAYTAYRMVFTELKDTNGLNINSLQFAEISMNGTIIPEPSTLAIVGLMAFGTLVRRRRR